MLNCGLKDLRLVSPRDGWPSERAEAMASGALALMNPVQVYGSTREAIADLNRVYATTARPRNMVQDVFTPRAAVEDFSKKIAEGQRVGILFGAERSGLVNDDVALAQAVITVPLNPEFSSLNLAQAVLLVAYEWAQTRFSAPEEKRDFGGTFPAKMSDINALQDRMEIELEKGHFFRSPEMRPTIMRNIRNMFTRAGMTDQEVRTFHGIISALTGQKNPPDNK